MNNETTPKSFWEEVYDRKTRLELVRTASWTAAFALTFYGIKKLFS